MAGERIQAGRCPGCGCGVFQVFEMPMAFECEHCSRKFTEAQVDAQEHWPAPGQRVRSWFNGEVFRVGCHVGGGRGGLAETPLESPGKNTWYRRWPRAGFPANFWAVYELLECEETRT